MSFVTRLRMAMLLSTAAWLVHGPSLPAGTGQVTLHSEGLHGYIGFGHEAAPPGTAYNVGMGFYAAVWRLIDQPLANFQIGLPSAWILPDNSDNPDRPLCPPGTLARTWKERGPTWSSVFQTIEGGLGYWAGNHFRYGPPKFSMNGTPQCYDYEIGSPGWSFFYSDEALPDDRLGIAQLSNRLLIPPDGLTFQGDPNGEFLGYTWMALPFTDPIAGEPPTGEQSWTCFLNAANFKGPIAFYIPETWSKIGKLFNDPFLYGRGLDARPGIMGGGAMEINTVPRLEVIDAEGKRYSRIPKLQFPVDVQGRAFLVQDVTYYSRAALYDAFKVWRDGGPPCTGRFDERGAWKPRLHTHTPGYRQAGQRMAGVEQVVDTRVFEGNVWGLQWLSTNLSPKGVFPEYYQQIGERRVVVPAATVPCGDQTPPATVSTRSSGPALHLPHHGRLGSAWAHPRPVHGQASGRVGGHVLVVSVHRSAVVPAIQVERREEGQVAGLRRTSARGMADRSRLHATPHSRQAGRVGSRPAGHAAPGSGGRLRTHCHPSSGPMKTGTRIGCLPPNGTSRHAAWRQKENPTFASVGRPRRSAW